MQMSCQMLLQLPQIAFHQLLDFKSLRLEFHCQGVSCYRQMDFRTAYAYSDMGGQLNGLIYKGFATDATMEYFPRIEFYLDAMLRRIEKVAIDPNRDTVMLNKFKSVEENYQSLLGLFAGKIVPLEVKKVRFMLEELRISYFAQSIRTLYPVSDKRINVEIDRLREMYRR